MKTSGKRFVGALIAFVASISLFAAPAFASGASEDVGNALPWEGVEALSGRYADEETGSAICRSALALVGTAYSQNMRYNENYVDCSSFVERSMKGAGISFGGTAAEQARQCVENSCVIEKEQAAPGDIVFWKKVGCTCGRSMEIHHVGIYLGDGLIAEASSSKGKVVVRDVWETAKWQIAFYARVY